MAVAKAIGSVKVAPLVGAWIEIVRIMIFNCKAIVAPLVGAWIEIASLVRDSFCFSSLLL